MKKGDVKTDGKGKTGSKLLVAKLLRIGTGGEGGIRTPGTSFSRYNGLANRRIQPLCHLSVVWFQHLSTSALVNLVHSGSPSQP